MSKIDYTKIGQLLDAVLAPAPTTDGLDIKHAALEGLKRGIRQTLEEKFPAAASATASEDYAWDGTSEPPHSYRVLVIAGSQSPATYEYRSDGSCPGWVDRSRPMRTPGVDWRIIRPYARSVHKH